jgi:hypothetical protein
MPSIQKRTQRHEVQLPRVARSVRQWSAFARVNDRDKNVTVLDKDREKLLDDCIKDFYRPHAEIRVAD